MSVILLFTYKDPKILIKLLIHPLGLSICVRDSLDSRAKVCRIRQSLNKYENLSEKT